MIRLVMEAHKSASHRLIRLVMEAHLIRLIMEAHLIRLVMEAHKLFSFAASVMKIHGRGN